jgi:hypothetical protein
MVRFFAQTLLTIIGNAIGLIAAALILPDFRLDGFGFVVSVLFFTVAYILLLPFILKMAVQYAPAFRGGIALVATFAVLVLTTIFTNGVQINSITTWVIAPLIMWFVTVLSGIILPMFLFKKILAKKNSSTTQK